MNATPLEELEKMPFDALVKTYNRQAESTVLGLDFYRREIEWRMQRDGAKKIEEITVDMRDMTRDIRRMTVFVIVLTVVNIFVAAYPLLWKN